MRKLIGIAFALVLGLLLSACDNAKSETSNSKTVLSQGKPNVLIVYFSATGNTKKIAHKISENITASIFEIQPKVSYTTEDLNYNNDCRANREQNDDQARPLIAKNVQNIEQYDVIFVGFPVWWNKPPKIMYTFLEQHNLAGKIIIPFCTSGSSNITASVDEIRKLQPKATVYEGRRFSANTDSKTIQTWIQELHLK